MKGYRHTITLTPDEHKALSWLADRYCSAEVLIDCIEWYPQWDAETDSLNDPELAGVDPIAWEGIANAGTIWGYIGALDALEDHNEGQPNPVPPSAGGTLAEKLTEMLRTFPGTPEEFGL